jgi:hypothetical protein
MGVINNRNNIFVFETAKSEKEAEKLVLFRNFLKENSINRIILVSFEELSSKMSDDKEEAIIEEIFMLEDNPDDLPIIFYGGDYEDFFKFLFFCKWEDREDMKWIENPRNINDLKEALKEISG